MKTIKQKTDSLLEELIYCDFRTEIDVNQAHNIIMNCQGGVK